MTVHLPSVPSLPRVARSEAELLELAQKLIAPSQRYLPMLRQRPKRNLRLEHIGPTAMGLLQQTLARGVAAELLRRGGWETRRTLVDGRAKRGRLWQRHPQLPTLRFGPASFQLLSWLRAEDVAEPKLPLDHDPQATLGDELLHLFAAAHIVLAGGDLRQAAFLHSPLCQLAFPDALASAEPLPDLDFRPLAHGDGAIILEALQSELARRWVWIESSKQRFAALDSMLRLGTAQTHAFESLARALDLVNPRRRELAGFYAEAARELLAHGPERRCPDYRWWIGSLDLRAPLAARQAAFTAAAAFLRTVGTLGCWLDEAGLVAHFDDDYEAAQLLLSSWQFLRATPEPEPRARRLIHDQPQIPASIIERANMLAHQLDSLHSLGAASPTATGAP